MESIGFCRSASVQEPLAFWLNSERLQVKVDRGAITYIRNRATGEVHTTTSPSDLRIPRGLGRISGSVAQAAQIHGQWSSYSLPPCGSGECSFEHPAFHHPYAGSTLQLTPFPGGCLATYTGLSDGSHPYGSEKLRLRFRVGDRGDLTFRAEGTSPDTGVFGALVPLANLDPVHRIYVPSFGGSMFDRSGVNYRSSQPALLTLDRAPFWEAPVVAAESTRGSLGLWIEDAEFRPNIFFMSWTGSSFALGIEQLNLMGPERTNPFPYQAIDSTWWHLDGFDGGWAAAMAPYRDWYAQQFAAEMARRAGPAWAGDVRVIVDQYTRPCENLQFPPGDDRRCDYQCVTDEGDCDGPIYAFLRQQLGDEQGQLRDRVLLHESNARCDPFDGNLPRHEPKPQFPARNRRLQAEGFRTMGYVNAYVVNFGSDAFNRLCVIQNALARRHDSFSGLAAVTPPHDFTNACPAQDPPSPLSCPAGPPQGCPPPILSSECGFPGYPGELMYLDPQSAWLRDLHLHTMLDTTSQDGRDGWMRRTEFDAAYQDVAGLSGDHGNGGTLGDTQLFQSLQLGMEGHGLHYPMASEYGTSTIAFAVRWPLRGNFKWGDAYFQEWQPTHQRPVSSYLFGPDQAAWVFTAYARDNFHRHLVVADADALGGVAQVTATRFTYQADRGDLGHAWFRAKQFARRGLRPSFDTRRGVDSLATVYTDRSGGRYEYHVTAREQTLLDPTGAPLYSRITGLDRKSTSLALLGWPAAYNGEVFGLDPAVHYNLTGDGAVQASAIRVTDLSEGVKVRRYSESPSHVVLVLEALPDRNAPTTAKVTLYRTVPLLRTILNDDLHTSPSIPADTAPGTTYAVTLPARFVFVRQDGLVARLGDPIGQSTDLGRFIEKETGIDRGGEAPAWHQGTILQQPAFLPADGENAPHTFEWLVRVPTGATLLQVGTCDGSIAGDGSHGVLYLNGREVARDEETPLPGVSCDARLRLFQVPVGSYQGREILIGVATDNGPNNDGVSDLRWFQRPVLVP